MSKNSRRNQKSAAVETAVEIERITLFSKINPPMVNSWETFIKYVAINVFPLEILPIEKARNNKIICDDDGDFLITENSNTLQLVDFKSFVDQRTGKPVTTVTFTCPKPSPEEEYHEYMMEHVFNPLLQPDEDVKTPLAKLSWVFKGREHYVLLSLFKKANDKTFDVPCQDRFRRMSVRDSE